MKTRLMCVRRSVNGRNAFLSVDSRRKKNERREENYKLVIYIDDGNRK